MWRERSSCRAGRQRCASFALLLLIGCATTPPVVERPEPRPLGKEQAAYRASLVSDEAAREPSASVAPPLATGAITRNEALARALEHSPELAAFSWEVRAREGRAFQAGLRPNPELEAEAEDFGGSDDFSGFDGSQTTLLLSQRIETAGKRPKRRRAAEIAVELASWEYEAARLRVFARASTAFAEVLAAQERVALSAELVQLAASSVEAVRRLVSAGATPAVERTRASVELSTAQVELGAAERALEAARARLAATWGGTMADFGRAEGDLGRVPRPPPSETVRGWLSRNPELAAREREVARRAALVELEDARRIPDVTAAFGPRRLEEPDETVFVAGFSVPLPLFDRNQGARAGARSDLHKARHERRAATARLTAELERAYQELAARHDEVVALRERILPSADEAYRGVRRGYLRGLFRNVDVLDAQGRLFELRLREIDALRSYHTAAAEVERLTGTPLASGSVATDGDDR